jgi:hypothetical protein
MMVRQACAALTLLGLWASAAVAAPSASDLIRTCEAALAADYRNTEAAMCDWYVAPCGVCGKDGPPPLAWCLPPELTGAALAREVLSALRAAPALADTPAPQAVETVMKARYPCKSSP